MKLNTYLIFFLSLIIFFSCKEDDDMPTDDEPVLVFDDPIPYNLEVPSSLPAPPIPEDNPLTEEGVRLGRMLFYDPILSGDSTMSCATCHQPEFGFSDPNTFSVGIDGSVGTRQSMPIMNLAYYDRFTWDGAQPTLEAQAQEPVPNPIEMHLSWTDAESRLNNHSDYPTLFGEAFGTAKATKERAAKALSQFMRILISGTSRFDLAKTQGSGVFFTEEELRGLEIYNNETGQCFHCHNSTFSTDFTFQNNGLDEVNDVNDFVDKGLGGVTGNIEDMGLFKVPSLRNISLTAPYMHDGRFETLEEVIDHYSEGIKQSPTLNPIIASEFQNGLNLSEQEKSDLIAFIKTFTDTLFINNPEFLSPFE